MGLKDGSASELMKRYRRFVDSLQPQARFWAERQAKIERRRPVLDLGALRMAVSQRFSGSLPSSGSPLPGSGLLDGGDVADMAIVVILMMVQDGDQDLQSKMLEAEEQMKAKQALRALISEVQQLEAQLEGEATCATPGHAVYTCAPDQDPQAGLGTPYSTPTEAGCICVSDVQLGPNQGASTVGITAQQLASVIAQLQDKLDSDNEVSEEATMRLQMMMEERSKLLQIASDMEKSKSETDTAIAGNMKK
jgi:hypothetical protein